MQRGEPRLQTPLPVWQHRDARPGVLIPRASRSSVARAMRPGFNLSVWKRGPRPWSFGLSKGILEVRIGNDSGI